MAFWDITDTCWTWLLLTEPKWNPVYCGWQRFLKSDRFIDAYLSYLTHTLVRPSWILGLLGPFTQQWKSTTNFQTAFCTLVSSYPCVTGAEERTHDVAAKSFPGSRWFRPELVRYADSSEKYFILEFTFSYSNVCWCISAYWWSRPDDEEFDRDSSRNCVSLSGCADKKVSTRVFFFSFPNSPCWFWCLVL